MLLRPASLIAVLAVCLPAQSIRVYSEFERLDPFGNILPTDRAQSPREVLSPALVRNAFASFNVAVEVPEGKPYALYIAQNPENAVRANLYRQCWTRRGDAWIPDTLKPLNISTNYLVEPIAPEVPGQTILLLWLDVWVAGNAPLRRTRFELQLSVDDKWVIYPFELRMTALTAPASAGPLEPLAPLEAPSAETARAVMRSYLCGAGAPAPAQAQPTVRDMIRRNARQDLALVRSLEDRTPRAELVAGLVTAAGGNDPKTWCQAPPAPPADLGAEWYLRVRTFLLRVFTLPPPATKP